jgi:hypothetical protein
MESEMNGLDRDRDHMAEFTELQTLEAKLWA